VVEVYPGRPGPDTDTEWFRKSHPTPLGREGLNKKVRAVSEWSTAGLL